MPLEAIPVMVASGLGATRGEGVKMTISKNNLIPAIFTSKSS